MREADAELLSYREVLPVSGGPEAAAMNERKDFVAVFSPGDGGGNIAVVLGPLEVRWDVPAAPAGAENKAVVKRWLGFDDASKRRVRIRFDPEDPTLIDFPDLAPVATWSAKGILLKALGAVGVVLRCAATLVAFVGLFLATGLLVLWTGRLACGLAGSEFMAPRGRAPSAPPAS